MTVSIWNATEQKLEQVGGNVNINDSVISEDSTFSSKKIHDSLVDNIGDLSELKTADKSNVVNAINEVAESSGGVYSTEETVIGTWIDGKPIYRLSGISTTATLTSEINKTIIDSMIRSDVHVNTPDFIYGAMSYVGTSSPRSCYEINKSGIILLSGISFNKVVFTFEYTKTTD